MFRRPQRMQSRVRALSYARISGTKGGAPPGSAAVIELLLCWLVSHTYRLYCSGSKVALGLSLRARLLTANIYVMPIMTRRCITIFTALLPAAR